MFADMTKKKVVMIGLGVVFLALLAFVGWKLYHGINQFSKAEDALDSALKEVSSYYARDPFPATNNISVVNSNVSTLQDWYATLAEELQKGEIGPARGMSPSKFKEHLGEKRALLVKLAEDNKVLLAEKEEFSVGFEKYFAKGSEMPLPSNVPRLTQQLTILEKLCTTLIEERVNEIIKVHREVFEVSQQASSTALGITAPAVDTAGGSGVRRRRATDIGISEVSEMINSKSGIIEEGMLFAAMRFRFDFKASEEVLLNLLNRLARDPMFAVVSSLTVKKDGEDVFLPKSHEEEEKEKKQKETGLNSTATTPQPARRLRGAADTETASAGNAEPAPADNVSTNDITGAKFSRKLQLVSGPKFEKPMNITLVVDVYRFKGVNPE